MDKKILTGLFPEEISALLPKVKEKYRGLQIFRWIHERYAETFDEMTNLPKDVRARLGETFSIGTLHVDGIQSSEDSSTDKYLFSCRDGFHIESVVIRDDDRTTVCISSQVGCKMRCAFCRTGGMGFIRNLTPGEIVDQLINIRRILRSHDEDITNIVFMGMGEPLDNLDNVIRSIRIINMETGLGIGQRKITVSTCGIVPGIRRLATEFKRIGLAVSLNAPDDPLRSDLMPINGKYPLSGLIDAAKEYTRVTKRRVTFEYILIDGVNDSPLQAQKLRKISARIPSKINLIGFNEFEGCPYSRPSDEVIENFQRILYEGNITAIIRKSKGSDILAACGQLASEKMKKNVSG